MKAHSAKSRIRMPDGQVTTIGEALDRGDLVLRKASAFYAADGVLREAFFADLKDDPGNGWRITPGLYRSRMGLPVVPPRQ